MSACIEHLYPKSTRSSKENWQKSAPYPFSSITNEMKKMKPILNNYHGISSGLTHLKVLTLFYTSSKYQVAETFIFK